MYEPDTGRLRRQAVAKVSASRHNLTFLFGRAIHARWNDQSMPVNEFRSVRIVKQIDSNWDTFPHANERAGNLSVVPDRAYRVTLCDICEDRRYAQRNVGFASSRQPG
jgi:hypothetical protein